MGKKILISSIVCIVLIAIPSIVLIWKSPQNNSNYIYSGRSLSLSDYTLTNDQTELIFIGRLNTFTSITDSTINANITYTKEGKEKTFLIPYTNALFALVEPKTYSLDNTEVQKKVPLTLSELRALQGRTMAFYIGVTALKSDLAPSDFNAEDLQHYQIYTKFLNTYIACNQQFLEEKVGFSQTAPCTPYIQGIVVKK